MQSTNRHSRVDLIELKARLMKKVGPERSKQYFLYLNKLLSLKLSKAEFNKVCFRILGRENVRLHNLLIHSILKNACNAEIPPPLVTSRYRPQNGDVLLSPRSARPRPLARVDAKVDSASHQPITTDNRRDVPLAYPKKLPSAFSVSAVEDGNVSCFRTSLQAPFGVPLFTGTISGARRVSRYAKSYVAGRLLDSKTLKEQMQRIATLEGLKGVSMDCADTLNNGLDVYLKRLITMSIELVGTGHGCKPSKNNRVEHHQFEKLVNSFGISATHHDLIQNNSSDSERTDEKRSCKPISLLDFKVAMELNPQRLGEDWPAVLEKLCMQP